jgi:hypothetical protein
MLLSDRRFVVGGQSECFLRRHRRRKHCASVSFSEFFGGDDEPEVFGSAPEFHVDREQAAAEDVCERDVSVDRQRQRSWRDCASQATTFGIGSPHAVLSQPQLAGMLAISGGASDTAPLAPLWPAATTEWSFSMSLCKRSLRVTTRILAPTTPGKAQV